MGITVIHPSYGRPAQALQTANSFINLAKSEFQYILCCSKGDPLLQEYNNLFDDFLICKEATCIAAMNLAAKYATGDLIVCISDDFECFPGWDEALKNEVKGKKDFVLQVDDGVRAKGCDTRNIVSFPIMDKTYYSRYGFVYHPSYKHHYADEELFRVALATGKLIRSDLVFKHVHYINGARKDLTYQKNSKHHEQGKQNFAAREKNGFDLQTLNILIATLDERKEVFAKIDEQLKKQISELKAENLVQIIPLSDNREMTLGEKRNRLVELANKNYLAFVDDDDRVCDNYVQLLLTAIQEQPDCCSLNGIINIEGREPRIFKHSIQYNGWYEKKKVYYRYPNHLNCVKTEIAKLVGFQFLSYAEDKAYSDDLKNTGRLIKEQIIEPILYYYDYVTGKQDN
jgi:glycosyltransferase involved in cell wall biosynthesis